MKNKVPVLAKPSGISLADHTRHVGEEAMYILDQLPFLSEKYQRLTGGDLREELRLAARYHDWGKSHQQWQKACQEDHKVYLKWRQKNDLSNAPFTPEEYRRFEKEMRSANKNPGKHLMNAGLRHELASLEMIDRDKIQLSEAIKAAIGAHHGKMGFRNQRRWKKDGLAPGSLKIEGPFYPQWIRFERLSAQVCEKGWDELLKIRYRFAAIRSLLQLADTRASRKEGEGEHASYDICPFELKQKFATLRPVQEAALGVAGHDISILRAPTGSGKTYAALLWAEQQVLKHRRADRLVIAMPTRFTSNALAISTEDQLGETGLYHSSAWYNRYGDIQEKEAIKNAKEAHRMARFLATPVTVCTIDHLLICLTGTKEAHHSTFYFLANSAVVFDEADFYDPFIQANIVILLKVLRSLKVPVLIMSATVPDAARKLYEIQTPIATPPEENIEVEKKLQYLGSDISRGEQVLKEMLELGHGIIYANTISRALCYYKWLRDSSGPDKPPIILYHSRFTEPDKKRIEEKLIQTLGKAAWENRKKVPVKGIAIMTQIGEMSVNISAPLMLSDLCPWDRLAQRIGRLVRFGFCNTGICYVVAPIKDETLYPAPYGEFEKGKKRWKAYDSLTNTHKQLKETYTEASTVTPQQIC